MFRLDVPLTTETSDFDTPSNAATKRSASAFALPSTGGAATRSLRASSPYAPSMDVCLAPGETLTLRIAPSLVETTKPLLTPAQKAAGPEDAAVAPLSFLYVEELLRTALLG